MAFQLSPGVNVSEIDLTTIVPSVGTTEGAFAGEFIWGPVDVITTVSNEVELVNTFGKPDSNTFTSFFTCANFLSYAKNLKVVRVVPTTAYNAHDGTGNLLVKNRTDYEHNYTPEQTAESLGMFAARYPGDIGNSLKVEVCAESAGFSSWAYKGYFDGAPGTSDYTSNRGGSDDEMHIIVIDRLGLISGTADTVLEVFPFVSKASDAKNDDGSSNYYVNVILTKSKYIFAINHAQNNSQSSETSTWGKEAQGTTFAQTSTTYSKNLSAGTVGAAAASSAVIEEGYDKFANPEEVDISLVLTGSHAQAVQEYVLENIAGTRKDCIAFISPPRAACVDNAGSEVTDIITFRNLFNSTSYGVLDNNWKYQFDKYNNVYRWVPLNGDIAGLCVRTDFERDPWYSPAGFNRGQVKNVVKLAWAADKADRDDLYKIGINTVVSFPGEGVVLYGDKTMQTKPSAFDRINVRRLFIVLEKAIARAARYSLFEFNDEFTRAQFVALVEPFLRTVKGRRGIYDFRVVCDTTNNTPDVIDRNEFVGDIYIKPARSINFIQLNFIAVRTGVAFEEIVGKF